jgi:ankyrin repeat protein
MATPDRISLLQNIVQRFPLAMTLRGSDTYTPLHTALQYGNILSEVAPFLQEFPELTNVDRLLFLNYECDTPLHIAIAFAAPYNTLEKLIDMPRTVLCMANRDNFTPLHHLFYHSPDLATPAHIRLLSFPESIPQNDRLLMCVDDKRQTPLYQALLSNRNSQLGVWNHRDTTNFVEIIGMLVDTQQDVLVHRNQAVMHPRSMFDVGGIEMNTPLHLAVQRRMPWAILKVLIDQHQNVLHMKNFMDVHSKNQHSTPLHIAVQLVLPEDTVVGLMDQGAQVLLARNHFNDMPLHTALRYEFDAKRPWSPHVVQSQNECTKTLIRRGVEAHVDFLLHTGHGGDTALHAAVKHNASLDMVRMLVHGDDQVLCIANLFGEDDDDTPENREQDTPLHSALKHGADNAVLELLLDASEVVLFMTNSDEETPVHIAARLGMKPDVIQFLIPDRGPPAHLPDAPFDVRLTKNKDGNTPLHLALLAASGAAVVKLLLDTDGDVLSTNNNDGNTPWHLALLTSLDCDVMQLLE